MGAVGVKTHRKKICVVTGSRADYGLLYWLIREVKKDKDLRLQLIVTGMHLSKQFGSTYKLIEQDGFQIDKKLDVLLYPNTEVGVAKSIGLGCSKFVEALERLKPDVMVVLGDRYEIFAATIAAYVAKIPVAHIHGGEVTQGAVDEGFRHSISKMTSIHFPTTEDYRKRLIQLGENPKMIFNYGAPGLDSLHRMKLLTKKQLEDKLKFDLSGPIAIATYHPETLDTKKPKDQIDIFLKTIKESPLKVIFTKANADAHGELINQKIKAFCKQDPNRYKFFDNLGQTLYYSCLKNFDLMIGNSSSGLIEAPSFGLPVVNVGDRQKQRIKAKNVIDVTCSKSNIEKGIQRALTKRFVKQAKQVKNPYDHYGDGKTSYRIKQKLKAMKINGHLTKKQFVDLPINTELNIK